MERLIKKGWLLALLLSSANLLFAQQLNVPLNQNFRVAWDRQYAESDSLSLHTALLPRIEKSGADYDTFRQLNHTDVKYHFAWLWPDKAWIKRKLKKENFIDVRGKDFRMEINPILFLDYGRDLANNNSVRFFKNARGFHANVHLTNKFSFHTSFTENQMRLPAYLRIYASSIGVEYFQNGAWRRVDPVVPGQGRTKPFKDQGYDFAFAEGYFSFSPTERINVQGGNGKFFLGEGYRSVIWSDNAFNYPFLRVTTEWLKGRMQYSSVYASLQHLRRMRYYTTPESGFERKAASFHYLDYTVSRRFQLGIFESTVLPLMDSLQQQVSADPVFFVPVAGISLLRNGFDNNTNVMVGVNAKYLLNKTLLFYGQFAMDSPKESKLGAQLGGKWFDVLGFKRSLFQWELNYTSKRMYAHTNVLSSFSHYNQSMGLTGGGGTFEAMVRGYYRWDDWFVEGQVQFQIYPYYYHPNTLAADSPQWGKDVIVSDYLMPTSPYLKTDANLLYKHFVFGYVINPMYNLQATIGWFHRSLMDVPSPYKTSYLYVALRTSLTNLYFDI